MELWNIVVWMGSNISVGVTDNGSSNEIIPRLMSQCIFKALARIHTSSSGVAQCAGENTNTHCLLAVAGIFPGSWAGSIRDIFLFVPSTTSIIDSIKRDDIQMTNHNVEIGILWKGRRTCQEG